MSKRGTQHIRPCKKNPWHTCLVNTKQKSQHFVIQPQSYPYKCHDVLLTVGKNAPKITGWSLPWCCKATLPICDVTACPYHQIEHFHQHGNTGHTRIKPNVLVTGSEMLNKVLSGCALDILQFSQSVLHVPHLLLLLAEVNSSQVCLAGSIAENGSWAICCTTTRSPSCVCAVCSGIFMLTRWWRRMGSTWKKKKSVKTRNSQCTYMGACWSIYHSISSPTPSAAYIRQGTKSTLVQVMPSHYLNQS